MKRNLKRLPALLLAVILCLSLLPATALAGDIVIGDTEEWRIDDQLTLYIESDTGMEDWIHENGMYGGLVLNVVLAEGITEIPYHAFYKCSNLTTVEIPATVTKMGKNDVFEGCKNLTSITVAAENSTFTAQDGVLYNADQTELLICPPGKSGNVTLPTTVTRIAGSAFKDCAKLTGVTLHEGITKIENVVFEGCDSLTEVTLPATLTSLGNGAFNNCAGLTSLNVAAENADFSSQDGVLYDKDKTELLLYPMARPDTDFTIPDSVTRIDSYAFEGARYLKNVTAGNLTSIESSAFTNCESLTSFSAKSLGKVEFQAFYDSPALKTFTLTEAGSLKTIEQDAFTNCSSLTGAPLAGATSIGSGAFQNCTALTSLAFCETDEVTIGSSAFSGCTGLTELTFPKSVKEIKGAAFYNCNKVTAVIFESATPPECGYNIFSIGDPNEFQIVVPVGSEDAYSKALGGDLSDYVGDKLEKKYPLFVNGKQFTSETTSIPCGSGTASFDVETSTLTLNNATIENMGGNYGYGGAINSGLANLTIKLMGNNTIRAQRVDSSGQSIRDSINSSSNCNIKIVSGETGTPALTCDVIDMGRGGPYNGGENAGNLMVDGVNLTVNDYVFVQHDITFQNGAQVNVTGRLTANHNAVITVEGENTDVTVESISMGNGTAHLPNDNKLVLESGALTITESVAFPGTEDGDRNPYAIHFDPVSSGSIAITGGMFVKQASCAGTNIDESKITQADNLPVQGSWESGTLIIGPASDGKYSVTVKSDPTAGGVAYGGGRYAENEKATLTATAQPGWFFIGWYQDNGDTAVSTSKSHEYTVEDANVTFTAKFIEDKLYQAEQAKHEFDEAQKKDSLTWDILTDSVDAYEAVQDFLTQVKGIDGLLTDAEKTELDNRYTTLTNDYKGITTLDLSNQNLGSADLEKLDFFTGLTELNFNGTALTDLTGLSSLTKLKTLDLSGTGITNLSALKGLTALETLDISNTGVTVLDSLIPEGSSNFPGYKNLTAMNLSLTSISALAGLVGKEGFDANDVTKWDFTGSTLPPKDENRGDVETIKAKLGSNKFLPPDVPESIYQISASPETLNFGSVSTSYAQPAAQTVTITNTGNQKVTLTQPTSEHYILSSITATELEPNGTATFTVWPKQDMAVGTYNETLTVTGSSGSQTTVALRFEVKQQTGGGSTGGSSGYSVSVPASSSIKGGSITVSPRSAEEGETVSITIKPKEGYELSKLTVTDIRGNELKLSTKDGVKYTFIMPDTRVDISVSFVPVVQQPVNPFTDVSQGDYYYDAVLWAAANGVTNGTGANTFSPNAPVTRSQMVTFLWRAYGSPKATGSSPFADVSADAWYYDAVLWAVTNGVTNGTTATTFSPDAPVTRSQAVTFQWRAAGSPVVAGDSFDDVAADTYYAGAVTWAVANGITNGTGGNKFSPEVTVTRAQAVTFLYRELA